MMPGTSVSILSLLFISQLWLVCYAVSSIRGNSFLQGADVHSRHGLPQAIRTLQQTLDADAALMAPLATSNRLLEAEALEAAGASSAEHMRSGLRALQQAAEAAEVTPVATPQELLEAVASGAMHIEVRAHLDLTTALPRDGNGSNKRMLNGEESGPDVQDFGWSIRGNCSEAPTEKELEVQADAVYGWREGQCVLKTDVKLMSINQNLWLHNFYIVHEHTKRTDTAHVMWCGYLGCNLWITSVTFEGSGGGGNGGARDPGGLKIQGGLVYAEGVHFLNFDTDSSVVDVSGGATVTLHDSKFVRVTISDKFASNALLTVSAVDPDDIYAQQQDTILYITDLAVIESTSPNTIYGDTEGFFTDFDVQIYSDETRDVNYTGNNATRTSTLSLESSPRERKALDTSSPFLVNLLTILPEDPSAPHIESPADARGTGPLNPAAVPLDPRELPVRPEGLESGTANDSSTSSSGGGGEGPKYGAIAGASAAVVMFLVALVCGVMLWRRHRKHAAAEAKLNLSAGQNSNNSPDSNGQISLLHNSNHALGVPSPPQDLQLRAENPLSSDYTHSQFSNSQFSKPCTGSANLQHIASFVHTGNNSKPVHGSVSHTGSFMYVAANGSSTLNTSLPHTGSFLHIVNGSVPQNGTLPHDGSTNNFSNYTPNGSTTQDTFNLTHTVQVVELLPKPGDKASLDEKFDFLHQQLDSFGRDLPVFDDLVLLGGSSSERMQGGQAVVQMAAGSRSREEFAMKFFVSREAFEEEHAMYMRGSDLHTKGLAQFLPQVRGVHSNEDGMLKDAHGHALPPCIVMERGESLDKWAKRAKPDRFQAATVISQVALRLKEVHALGYVHRDLKPGNVMWLPRENSWTIIDFGCAAKIGERARVAFSVAYAAPEVIHAYRNGIHHMVAEEAVDAWSLGVMAFELLTGNHALPMIHGKDHVMDRIEGLNGLQLPWEEDSLTRDHKRKLGIFRDSVAALLRRAPSQRSCMATFLQDCNQVLAGNTTVQT